VIPAPASARASTAGAPLAGVRVLELGSTVAGPFCGRLLGDFGAEVIKVEAIEGDIVRRMGKQLGTKSLYAASIFRNKALIAVDLRTEAGRAIVRDLAAISDVVVENFRPGRLEEWNLGYESLEALNPGLILVRISGFGQDGPLSSRGGYGVIGEAVGGLRHITGDPDRPPARAATSLTDYISGLYGAFGAALALFARGSDGRGQVVDVSLFESAFSFMEPWIPAYEQLGYVAGRHGSKLPGSAPNNLYPTADAEFIHITAVSDALFARLAEIMGHSALAGDERFVTPAARVANSEALDELIAQWTGALPLSDIEAVLHEADVPASRIFTMAEIFADEHYRARGSIVAAPDPELGTVAVAGVFPRLSRTPGRVVHAGRPVGADTREVLTQLLAMDATTITSLDAAGVIRCSEVGEANTDTASGGN